MHNPKKHKDHDNTMTIKNNNNVGYLQCHDMTMPWHSYKVEVMHVRGRAHTHTL